ncbi:MAG: 50S ribosomal protein L21 [Vampirovibrio sp.]
MKKDPPMTRAIVEISGKQYHVEAGRYLDIDTYNATVETALIFENVNVVLDESQAHIGQPYVAGAKVTAKVLAHGKHKKVIVYKMRPKKGTRTKQGHRQGYTRILVESITV